MKTAQLINCTVKQDARLFDTRYGQRVKAIVSPENGDDIDLWDDPNSTIHSLKAGQQIQVTWNGKKYTLIATQQNSTKAQPVKESSHENYLDIAEMALIVKALEHQLPQISESGIVTLAQSIFKYRHS